MKNPKRLAAVGLVLLALLGCRLFPETPTPTSIPTTAQPEPSPQPQATPQPTATQIHQNLLRSTVLIVALQENNRGRLSPIWSGSGTIISPDGFILTNAHVASDADPDYQPDALSVALTIRSDEPPEPAYLAEVRAIDYKLDLAVIQIVSDLDGRPIDPQELDLRYVSLGDSDLLELGDRIEILGYPGIGGETITFTEGVVSGFTREQGVEGRAWIKTDATIAGGNSGGLAANLQGELIGVPTQLGYGGDDRYVDCRQLADTNGDGRIDANDNCIPVGGFINALRPINLARPLIEAALAGEEYRQGAEPRPSGGPTGQGRFRNLVFSPDVTDDDQPTEIVEELPSGATGLYAFWEYDGMNASTSWEARWYLDGEYLKDVSWPPAPWPGDEEGSWWIGIINSYGLDDGLYTVELYIEDELALEGSIAIGEASASRPSIAITTFSDSQTPPPTPTFELDSGISQVYGFFDYAHMRQGMMLGVSWLREGEAIFEDTYEWTGGASGSNWVSLYAQQGALDDGHYRLVLSVDGRRLDAADFSIGGPSPATDEGLYIRGYIRDADTGRGIRGAFFIVLKPGITSYEWDGDEASIYTAAQTNASGYFEMPDPLERNQTYTMIILAEGYTPIIEDNILVSDEPSPYDVMIELQRK